MGPFSAAAYLSRSLLLLSLFVLLLLMRASVAFIIWIFYAVNSWAFCCSHHFGSLLQSSFGLFGAIAMNILLQSSLGRLVQLSFWLFSAIAISELLQSSLGRFCSHHLGSLI